MKASIGSIKKCSFASSVKRHGMSFVLAGLFPLVLLSCISAPRPATRPASSVNVRASTTAPYLTADEFDIRAILSPPPADNSATHQQEVERILSLQESRTPEEAKRCKSEEKVTVFAFDTVLGSWFNARDLPVTAALMNEVYFEVKTATDAAKKVWPRIRPPLADQRIHPCVELETSLSYPSGHAARGIVWATLLAEIFPVQRDELMARGQEIGDDRFLGGMHYPSDVVAGQKLGKEIARRLLANPAFVARLEECKTETLAGVHTRN